MSSSNSGRYVVFSDVHFGMEESSVNRPGLVRNLADFLADESPLRAVIFSGDLIDLNLSTFTTSIEGKGPVLGFRRFIEMLNRPGRPPLEVSRWIYVPGNHDYKVWDLLSTKSACTDVLSRGDRMGTVSVPVMSGSWRGGDAFISGVFPGNLRSRVIVEYPDYEIDYSDGKILVTHGHYLDPKQTLNNRLERLEESEGSRKKALRKLFIETAQYQTLAGAVSFTPEMRRLVNLLVGPKNLTRRLKRFVSELMGRARSDFLISPLRGEPVNSGQLRAIEFYIKYFSPRKKVPGYFIFGHTHVQGRSATSRIPRSGRLLGDKIVKVYNVGSFYPRGDKMATFLVIDVPDTGPPEISPFYINKRGHVKASKLR